MISFSVLIIGIVIFFAMNMGGSGIAPSFGPAYGAGIVSRAKAAALFSIFVILGAIAFGGRVTKTISTGFISKELFTPEVALVILFSAALSLFIANILRVPQSTSWVTVFAVVGAALHFGDLNWITVGHMVALWMVLPFIGFLLSLLFFRLIYPPRAGNFWFYEKSHSWENQIKLIALASSCYVAFAIGANNVANAAGPLAGANIISPFLGLLIIAPLFGLGAFAIKDRTMKTVGKEIVPLGILTSSVISFITASLLIVASVFGFPQSLVQLNTLAILAIGTIKHDQILAVGEAAVQKTFFVWLIAPILAGSLSYLLFGVLGI